MSSPYKGLSSFTERDAEIFFGRAAETRQCLANLRASGLTVLYAPSGVGKTSLLAAGVIPELKKTAFRRSGQNRPEHWPVYVRSWTEDPGALLSAGIIDEMNHQGIEAGTPEETWPSRLVRWTVAMKGPVFLILDQFEGIYTNQLDPAGVDRFIEAFGELIALPDSGGHVSMGGWYHFVTRVCYVGLCRK